GEQFAELGVAVSAHRGLEAHRDALRRTELVEVRRVHPGGRGQLGVGRVAAKLGHQPALNGAEAGELLGHVHRDADGAGVVLEAALHRLADPPGGVRGELEAAPVVELLHRSDQAEDALLDQVEERQPGAPVALGVGHHQPQVRLDHAVLGGLVAALDSLREVHLLGPGQERPVRDVAQEQLQRVASRLRDRLVRVGGLRSVPRRSAVDQLDAAAARLAVELLDGLLVDVEALDGLGDVGELKAAALLPSTEEVLHGALRHGVAHASQDTPTALNAQSASLPAPAYTLKDPSRTNPQSSIPRSRASSTARLDGAPTATRPARAARLAFWTSSNDARPLTHASTPGSGNRPRRSIAPIALSIALCRPTSSWSTSSSPDGSNSAVACRPPVRSNDFWLRRASAGARITSSREIGAPAGDGGASWRTNSSAPFPHTPHDELR